MALLRPIRLRLTLRWALAGLATGSVMALSVPAAAQFSPSYRFLNAVRDRDANKAADLLNDAPALVNTRDIQSGETGLMIAVQHRDAPWVNFLLLHDADPNIADRAGNWPIIAAASIGFADGVRSLIQHGARVNQTNGSGETPLHLAVQRRDVVLARVLMQAGANPDAQDNIAGMSPRDYAAADPRAAAVLAVITAAPVAPAGPIAGPH